VACEKRPTTRGPKKLGLSNGEDALKQTSLALYNPVLYIQQGKIGKYNGHITQFGGIFGVSRALCSKNRAFRGFTTPLEVVQSEPFFS